MKTSHSTVRQRLNISRWALAHPRLTIGFWLVVVLIGALAAWRMPVELFPDIEFPVIAVSIDGLDQNAAAVEQRITGPVEQRLLRLADRDAIVATTVAGSTTIIVPFDVGVSLNVAEQRVRGALAGLSLPSTGSISVRRIDLNESALLTLAVQSRIGSDRAVAEAHVAALAARLGGAAGVVRVVRLDPSTSAPIGASGTRVRLDGEPAVALQVIKRAGANTLEVARRLDQQIEAERRHGVLAITVLRAEAPYVREATGATLEALWIAALLAILVIHPFLRSARATVIAALAIPTSLVGTFLVMAVAGFKFETITLLALALIIGIVVDDAIVDLENIVRHLPRAADPVQAARQATDEIGLTVTAATLTIVAVFLPVGLMGGVVGTFFRPFGLTIAGAVLTSLLVARTLTPVLAALWLKVGNARAPGPLWQRFVVGYRRVLHWALAHPRAVLAGAVISLLAGVALIPLIPQGFIPALDRGECDIRYALPPGSGLAASDQMAQQLTRLAARDPDVAHILAIAELEAGATDRGVLRVTLRPDRRGTTRLIEARLRRALVSVRGAVISVDDIPIIAVAAQQPLAVTLTGKDVRALTGAARLAIGRIRTWQGVADVSLAGLGPDGDGTWLRRNGIPAAVIRGNLGAGTDLGTMTKRLQTELARVLPSGVQLQLEGESAQAAEVFAQFAPALGFAVVGVLAVLLFLFRSAQDPVAIAAALPLSVVGALLGLYVARSDFGIVSLLGLVFLIGLINKNAIILVDRINQLRTGGMAIEAAVLEAGPVRLRPIVMTTAAAVLGMVPIALGFGAGAELRAPMAVAIIGGLLTSTLLSLIVVPVIYCWLDRQFPRFRD